MKIFWSLDWRWVNEVGEKGNKDNVKVNKHFDPLYKDCTALWKLRSVKLTNVRRKREVIGIGNLG